MEDDVLSSTAHAADAAPHGQPMSGDALSTTPSDALLDAILETLSDSKAEDVVQIDLRGKSSVCDWMVVCSGRSTRQVSALAEHLEDMLKQDHGVLAKTEGKESGDWVLIDAGDVVVHVFRPEVREFYQLEKMWQPAGKA
jgi:ribosome-associated protein